MFLKWGLSQGSAVGVVGLGKVAVTVCGVEVDGVDSGGVGCVGGCPLAVDNA